ncbi:MAG: response regulator transcription factor [Clostridia bacterium]|nr:response regulator transcription factor [Clostridia bacterium]
MRNKYKILVIEDEKNINNLVSALMEANGYKALSAKTAADGKIIYDTHRPDLIILDLGLPDTDGMCLLREIRKNSFTPIIVLSARTEEAEKVKALDLGANDYVTKPFGSAELVARVRTVLRSTRHSSDNGLLPGGKFKSDGLVIDYDARRVFIDEAEIKLTQTEYNIIALLSEHSGKVLTYSFIIKAIWGYNDLGSTKRLQVNMANIRKKFGAKPGKKNYIVNELGVGYRMCEQNDRGNEND